MNFSYKISLTQVFNYKYFRLYGIYTNLLFSVTPQVCERVKSGANIIKDAEDAVQAKVLESVIVKSTMQSVAVKSLITTPDNILDADLRSRKR